MISDEGRMGSGAGFEDAERLYQRLVDRLVVLGPVLEEQRYRNEVCAAQPRCRLFLKRFAHGQTFGIAHDKRTQ